LIPLYAAGLAVRNLCLHRGWERIRILWYPVISVGNLSVGGSGKTPFTIELARLLATKHFHLDVLSRGYGRLVRQPARVRADGTVEQFGDEPLLIAQKTGVPVYVAPQRYDAGLLADHTFISDGGDLSAGQVPLVHVLDDGFQHRQLFRDIDILLIDRDDWNDTLLPAGNLREPLNAVRRAHVLAIPADDLPLETDLRSFGWSGPIWHIHRRMDLPEIDGPVAAFCGIARPNQFFAGLKSAGLNIVARHVFRDHHSYTPRDIEHLVATARAAGATALLTTEKDAVRLASHFAASQSILPILTAALTVRIEDEHKALDWLVDKLAMTHLAQAHRNATRRLADQ
jgi:tetraacyldisaccharide 4'-kinase